MYVVMNLVRSLLVNGNKVSLEDEMGLEGVLLVYKTEEQAIKHVGDSKLTIMKVEKA